MSTFKFTTTAVFAAALISASGALAQTASVPAAPASNEINYVSQLPSPSELSSAQPPAGARISKISQTASGISVTYVFGNGQIQVVSYRLLASASAPDAAPAAPPAATAPAAAPTAVIQSPAVAQPSSPAPAYYYDAPAPAVVYQVAPPVYYDGPGYYSYYPWYPPISLGLNFGFRGGYGFRGGFRGGFRH
jgi:hypothetical protein